jgi:peptidoglycan/LPS O-acetylase OafA/YrhL
MTTLLKLDHKSKSVQVLRAVAFLFVFLSHAFTKLGWWGAFGVSLFIVLSGYLETKKHLYDDISALPFAIKKIKKVYPLHIIMMLFAIPLSAKIVFKRHGAIKLLIQIFFNATMAQSWAPIGAIYYSLNAVSWYLTLVVFFALISPKFMRWLRNSSVRKIKIVVLTLICCDFIVGYLSMRLPEAHWIAYVCPVTRSFDYIIGGYICSGSQEYKNMDATYRINSCYRYAN